MMATDSSVCACTCVCQGGSLGPLCGHNGMNEFHCA